MHTGEEPPAIIDHINRDRLDNRWCNLRAGTPSGNIGNSKRTGSKYLPGVYFSSGPRKKPWAASFNKKTLGMFATEKEAHEAYAEKHREHFGEFSPYWPSPSPR